MLHERVHRYWKLLLAIGIMNAIIGLAVFFPITDVDKLCVLVGILLILGAVAVAFHTVTFWTGAGQAKGWIQVAIRLVTAYMLIFTNLDGRVTFTTLLAIYFGIDGALMIGEAQRVRLQKSLAVPIGIVGATSVLFSALIWLKLKGASYATISTLLAVTFLFRAAVIIQAALLARKAGSTTPLSPATTTPTAEAPAQA